jgi:hypothetical protein
LIKAIFKLAVNKTFFFSAMVKLPRNRIGLEYYEKVYEFISHVKHVSVKTTRKGDAGLQHDNNWTGKIQRE